jgi:hypothetical protein
MSPYLQEAERIDRELRAGRPVSEREIDALHMLRRDPSSEGLVAALRERLLLLRTG